MDLLGYASFAVPFFGEFFDLIWAPISGLIYWKTFGGAKGFLGGGFASEGKDSYRHFGVELQTLEGIVLSRGSSSQQVAAILCPLFQHHGDQRKFLQASHPGDRDQMDGAGAG